MNVSCRAPRSAYPRIGRKRFIDKLKPLLCPRDLNHVIAAYMFAKYAHRNQFRDGGTVRYFEHAKAVALILIDELHITDWHAVVLGLMHDVPEDSFLLTWERIELNFGKTITHELKLLTKQPKRGYIKRLRMHGSTRALTTKCCDRVHNLRTLSSCKTQKQHEQIAETRRVHIPLAELLISKLPKRERWRGEYLKNEMIRLCAEHEHALASKAEPRT